MIAGALALLVLQASGWVISPAMPTVGDTVYVTRRFAAEAGVHARVQLPAGTPELELLSDPQVTYSEGAVTVRYTFAFFDARRHAVALPDIELAHLDGRLVRVPGDTAWVAVASVLPATDTVPPPQPALEPIPRRVRRLEILVATALVALLAAGIWGAARRRTRPRPAWSLGPPGDAPMPLAAWLAAGEQRAVATAASTKLRAAIERVVPAAREQLSTDECVTVLRADGDAWPVDDTIELLRLLDVARFSPTGGDDLTALVADADRVLASYAAAPTADPERTP